MNKLKLKVLLTLKKYDELDGLSDKDLNDIIKNNKININEKYNILIRYNKDLARNLVKQNYKDVDATTLVEYSNYFNDYTYLLENFEKLNFTKNKLDFDDKIKLYMAILDYVNNNDKFLDNKSRLLEFNSDFASTFTNIDNQNTNPELGDIFRKSMGLLIHNNHAKFLDLIKSDNKFKTKFFDNICGTNKITDKLTINYAYFINDRDILEYLVNEKEFVDKLEGNNLDSLLLYVNKNNMDILYNLPIDKKVVIIKFIVSSIKNKNERIEEFKILFKELDSKKLEFIINLINNMDSYNMDFIREMYSFTIDIHDDEYYNNFMYLYENVFDKDFSKAEEFGHKYKNKKLYKDLAKLDKEELTKLKDKLYFLGSTSILKNIDNVDDIKNNSLSDIKKFKVDINSIEKTSKEFNVGDDFNYHESGKPILRNGKGVGIISPDCKLSILDSSSYRYHPAMMRAIITKNNIDTKDIDLKDENSMAVGLSKRGYTSLVFFSNEILIYMSSTFSLEDRDVLLNYLDGLNRKDVYIEAMMPLEKDGKYIEYALHNGDSMSIEDFKGELDRLDLTSKYHKVK